MNFIEKVKSMTAAEIILTMVEGLVNPKTDIVDMASFGHTDTEYGRDVCYGCAATNTILKILDADKSGLFPKAQEDSSETIGLGAWNPNLFNVSGDTAANKFAKVNSFLVDFEYAIDALRIGEIAEYNSFAKACGFAQIEDDRSLDLAHLRNGYSKHDLDTYRALAAAQ